MARALILVFLLGRAADAGATALAELQALADDPAARAGAAYDASRPGTETGVLPTAPPAAETPRLRKADPPVETGPKDEPQTPAEQAAWDNGKGWGAVLGGVFGLLTAACLVAGLWSGIGAWSLIPGAALLVGAILIGMDVGKHYALDEARGKQP